MASASISPSGSASKSISPSGSVSPSGSISYSASISPSPSIKIESVRGNPRLPIERVACRAYLSATQENLVDTNWTKVTLNTVNYDLGTNFDKVTNNRFVPPVSGLYAIRGKVDFTNIVADKSYGVAIYVKNAMVAHSQVHAGASTDEVDAVVVDEVFLNKTADYVELFAQSNSGGNTVDIVPASDHTYLGVRLITKEGIR